MIKFQKFIPEFQMYDPYVSQNVTIKDLVTHRAGLGLGQGDLMFFSGRRKSYGK